VLNWVLALASAALLILTFPRFSIVWLAPVALAPFLVAMVDSDGTPQVSEPTGSDAHRSGRLGTGPQPGAPARRSAWDDPPPPTAPVRRRRPVPSEAELRAMLQRHEGNVSEVARQLDRQWAVVWRTMRRYGIGPAEYKPEGAPPDEPPPNVDELGDDDDTSGSGP